MRLSTYFIIQFTFWTTTSPNIVASEPECSVADDGQVVCVQTEDMGTSTCTNEHELCGFWASEGECVANPNYMLANCKKSCNNCDNSKALRRDEGLQREEKGMLLKQIEKYGVAQTLDAGAHEDKTMLVIRKSIDYMKNFIYAKNPTHRIDEKIISQCVNNEALCAFWAAIGECENNASYMTTKCAPSCQTCADIDFDTRCPPRPSDAIPGLKSGELNVMMQRIVDNAPANLTDTGHQLWEQKKIQDNGTPYYAVNIVSRPESPTLPMDMETKMISLDPSRGKSEAPWVLTFDNFLTPEECDHLINLGHSTNKGYERSRDVGEKTVDGSYSAIESSSRTSWNSWCDQMSGCRYDSIATRVMERIANVTSIPSQNFEDFQMLRYEKGQFYKEHHDYIPHQKDRACGPRILTFFLYLSDVEEGGGTGLHTGRKGEDNYVVVTPRKGKALLWPSVMNYDPSIKDGRTRHEAISVEKGVKFAANVWIHLYDVLETQRKGCT